MSGAIPKVGSNGGTTLRNTNISALSPSDSHSACRNSGPISRSRPAPIICETEVVNEINVPIGTSIGSHNSEVPMVTAASVAVPWWPAMTLSTNPIRPVETWPSTSGNASRPVVRTSEAKPGVADGGAEETDMKTNCCVDYGRAGRRWHRVAWAGYLTPTFRLRPCRAYG